MGLALIFSTVFLIFAWTWCPDFSAGVELWWAVLAWAVLVRAVRVWTVRVWTVQDFSSVGYRRSVLSCRHAEFISASRRLVVAVNKRLSYPVCVR